MTKIPELDSKILGQILLLQSTMHVAADEARLGEQVCYTLSFIPEIQSSALYIDEVLVTASSVQDNLFCWPAPWSEIDNLALPDHTLELLPLQTSKMKYGYLVLAVGDKEKLSDYLPFIENTVNLISLLLENKMQDADLRKLNLNLEEQVQERTKALIESEKLFRSTFENAVIGMCLTSPEGYLQKVNPALANILGFPAEKLLSIKFSDFTHPDDIDLSFKEIKPLLDGKVQKILFEKRYIHSSGSTIWALVGTYLVRDSEGVPLYFITFVEDITSRKQAEERLESFSQRLAIHLEHTPLGVIEWDINFNVIQWNRAAEKIFGYASKEALGKNGSMFLVPETLRKHVAPVWRDLLANKGGGRSTNQNLTKDGKIITCDWYNTTLIDREGVVIGVASLVEDISEAEHLQEKLRQAHKMEAIGTLAGGIAHDFNNILAAILGYADMAMDDTPDHSPVKYQIQQILKAGNRAKELVKQILSFSRKEVHERVPTQPHLIVKEALKLLRAFIPSTVQIKQDIDYSCGNIWADPTQLHQIIMNICTNAAQAMDETGGLLEVDLSSIEIRAEDLTNKPNLKPGHFVRLSVKDQGIGINRQSLDRIFDPYYTTKETGKGSGMGLAVVLGIVKSHDGMITVDSEIGEGTTFNLFFPRIEEKIYKKTEDTEIIPTGKEKILVVDDEEIIVDMTKRRIERLGYQVTAKTNSMEALELFRAQPDAFDLIITDQTMPDLTGEELAKKLMEIRPDIPIILCTGYSSKMDAEKADIAGVSAFILKPADKKEFAKTIRQVLDSRTSEGY